MTLSIFLRPFLSVYYAEGKISMALKIPFKEDPSKGSFLRSD
jgi:hypothetical protein